MSDKFLLDTNLISEFNRTGKPNENVRQWLDATDPDSLFVSLITVAEILFGIELLSPGKRRTQLEQWMEQDFNRWFAGKIVPPDHHVMQHWAVISAKRQREGRPLAQFDGLIAATALRHGFTLVTRDVDDFRDLDVILSTLGTRALPNPIGRRRGKRRTLPPRSSVKTPTTTSNTSGLHAYPCSSRTQYSGNSRTASIRDGEDVGTSSIHDT